MAKLNPLATRAYVDDVLGGIPVSPGVDSYNDLKDLPSINGVTLKGDVTMETGGLDESEVRQIASAVTADEVGRLSKVARTGQYSDLGGLPTVNGKELKGDVTLETGGVDESRVESIVDGKIDALPKVARTGSYDDLQNRPRINGKLLTGDVTVMTDSLSETAVSNIATRVVSQAISTLPAAARSGSYDDLTDRPSVNGQVLEGDVTIDAGLSETDVRTVAGEIADGKVNSLPKAARTGSYTDLSDIPTINGVEVKGDLTIESGGLDELQMETVAARVAQSRIDGLPSVARTGSYGDLTGLPTINGQTLTGSISVGGDNLTQAQVTELSQGVVANAISELPPVARSGSYNDLDDIPSINGVPLTGNLTLGDGGSVEPPLSEAQVSRIAQEVTDRSLSAGNQVFSDAVDGVVTSSRKVFTSDWRCIRDFAPGCTVEGMFRVCTDEGGPYIEYLPQGGWALRGISVSLLDGYIDLSKYPEHIFRWSMSVPGAEDDDTVHFPFVFSSGPSDDPDSPEHEEELTIEFTRDYNTENRLGLAFVSDLDRRITETIDAAQPRFAEAVRDVTLDTDGDALASVCEFLGLSRDSIGENVKVGLLMVKMLSLMQAFSEKLLNMTRYDMVEVHDASAQLQDRAMNRVYVSGTYLPPPSVNGKARDFQVSVFNTDSLVVDVDLGYDMVFMDDARMDGSVVHVSGADSDGSNNVRMAIFTEVSAGVWYVNNIYDGSRTQEQSEQG